MFCCALLCVLYFDLFYVFVVCVGCYVRVSSFVFCLLYGIAVFSVLLMFMCLWRCVIFCVFVIDCCVGCVFRVYSCVCCSVQ